MASQDFDATGAPQDVVAALSLVVGTAYTVQNVDTVAVLFLRQAAPPPAASDRAHRIGPCGTLTIQPDTGEGVWLWTAEADGCAVIVTNAA